jgi:alpha-tubulin suppressor-like RCC1 family protein
MKHLLPAAAITVCSVAVRRRFRVMVTWLVRLMVVVGCIVTGVADAAAETATRIATGWGHTCALTTGGGVRCWGDNSGGQLGDGTTALRATPVDVSGLGSGVAAIATGFVHTCALTTVGSVMCWGLNSDGQLGDGTVTTRLTPTAVSALGSGVTAIATGDYHTCALTTGGGVVCWGDNSYGQLGDETTTDRWTPTPVTGLGSGLLAVAAGSYHTCALTTSGGVVCWGYNYSGQLGDGTATDRWTPTAVDGLGSGATAIAIGFSHSCAVTLGGGVKCWGNNSDGQLGDGTTTNRWTPAAVTGLGSGVAAIAPGGGHTCALTTSGGVKCWGWNRSGQLGDGTRTSRLTPTAVIEMGRGVAAIAASTQEHSCALTTAGRIMCWGQDSYGQLGDGTARRDSRSTPMLVSRLVSGVTTIAAGSAHTCALTTGGGVRCWGGNSAGQLGDGTTANRWTPTPVSGLGSGVVALAAGDVHTCAVTTGGGVLCWGLNSGGQLGDGTTTNRWTPTAVSGLGSGVTALAAGGVHTCALMTSGDVKCWGANGVGQLGDGTTTSRWTPTAVGGLGSAVAAIAAGTSHTCALTTGGGVKCWGYNFDGQLGDATTTNRWTPTAVSGLGSAVAAIEAGGAYTCAVTTGGGAKCWGDNFYGQLGDGTRTERLTPTAVSGLGSGVTAIAAGDYLTCALTTGGSVQCWGGTPPWTPAPVSGLGSGVAAIGVGHSHECALTTGGGVLCWGDDFFGQLGDGREPFALTPTSVYGFGGAITVGGITPAIGPTSGGTVVTIIGACFFEGATLTLGGGAATGVTVINSGELAATTPPHAAGVVDVIVRNPDGQATTLAGGFTYGASQPGFTDNPLSVRATVVKASHIIELRLRIDELRVRFGLQPFAWSDSTTAPGVTPVKAAHLAELRTALAAVYAAAGRTPPTYADATIVAGTTAIRATHIAELRAAVLAIW